LTYAGNRPDEPRNVYAVIRVIDNNSMINVSTAMARDSDGDGSVTSADTFYPLSGNPDREFRGRRPWEICVDAPKFVAPGVAAAGITNYSPALDADIGVPVKQMLAYRSTGSFAAMPAMGGSYYDDVIRRLLVGGAWRSGLDSYGLFRAGDE